MTTASRRGRTSTRLVAGGTVMLRLAGCFTGRLDVFAFLLFLVFAFIAGGDLLRRVLTMRRVQPEPLLRLGDAVVVHLRSKDVGFGKLGKGRSALDDSRKHLHQLFVGLLPPSPQLFQ